MDATAYRGVESYDGAVIDHGDRGEPTHCEIGPRDLEVLDAVRRHKFLTTPQLLELLWEGRSGQAGRRRLVQLFRAGYLDRFRPYAKRGSYPWTYHLARPGHKLLRQTGIVHQGERHATRHIYDYRYVLHELHLNAWVLAWRRLLGTTLTTWAGETKIDVPRGMRRPQLRLGESTIVEGLKDPNAKTLVPDDLLRIARPEGGERIFLLEYDRTRRTDKNFEKFRRYDAFLGWWWTHTPYADGDLPYVIFVCQDEEHRTLFLQAADLQLTGHLWNPSSPPTVHRSPGRDHILFANEPEMQQGAAVAYRVPPHAPGHPARTDDHARARGVRLPGYDATSGGPDIEDGPPAGSAGIEKTVRP